MTKTKKKILAFILIPIALLVVVWVCLALYQIAAMRQAAPDGKGRTAADYEAGRTATCVTLQFVKGGWAYPCTPSEQIRLGFENATLEMSWLPLFLFR